jgi:RimJ/RimL family protein N-acetyltransferase
VPRNKTAASARHLAGLFPWRHDAVGNIRIFSRKGTTMMTDTRNYEVAEKLKDGTVVTIRAIRPDDKDRFAEAFKNLERESVYTRFFRFKKNLTADELKTATEVDFENTVALVVTIPDDGGDETIIGAGRYVKYHPPNPQGSAEIAFTVEEDFQGRGIASRILRHLIQIAREKGVSQFEAEVLAENRSMLTVFSRSGLPVKQSLEGGTLHITISLSEQAP